MDMRKSKVESVVYGDGWSVKLGPGVEYDVDEQRGGHPLSHWVREGTFEDAQHALPVIQHDDAAHQE